MLELEGQHYLEIPYRTLLHPAVTLWEQRQALAKLRQQGREEVDESVLFRIIGQMREIVTTAQKATRNARRDADRRQDLKASILQTFTGTRAGEFHLDHGCYSESGCLNLDI